MDSGTTAARTTLSRYRWTGEAIAVITLHIPAMTCRRLVRAVTARVRDLSGVDAVEARADTATLVVHGTATEGQVRAALTHAGFQVSAPGT